MVPSSSNSSSRASLSGLSPRGRSVLFLLLLVSAGVTLALGLSLPTIELKELVFKKNSFSLLAGIEALWQEKYYFLASIIFIFSIIFPLAKLGVMAIIWWVPMNPRTRQNLVGYLELTGKWSMLDVYVVALMIIITRTSGLIHAKPLPGIYWFAGSVILAMFAGSQLKQLHHRIQT